MSPLLSFLFAVFLAIAASPYKADADTETITALVYADNYFQFYMNGVLQETDPLDFTPHNGIKFTFEQTVGESQTYAIVAKDYASSSGYEYTENDPQIGDGALRVLLSNGVVSNSNWKCFTTSFGPTQESQDNGCSATNLDACELQLTDTPDDWTSPDFDDSAFDNATEYTDAEAGWGMHPSYQNGKCGQRTSPLTRGALDPQYITTKADECLNPEEQDWQDSVFIWQADIFRDNTILCRLTVSGSSSSPDSPSDEPEDGPGDEPEDGPGDEPEDGPEGPDGPEEGPDGPEEGPDGPEEGPDGPEEGPDGPEEEGPDGPEQGPDQGPEQGPEGAAPNAPPRPPRN